MFFSLDLLAYVCLSRSFPRNWKVILHLSKMGLVRISAR